MNGANNLAIDFDGVIHQYDGYKDGSIYGEPMPNAIEALYKLQDGGYTIIIFTARPNLADITEWLDRKSKEQGFTLKPIEVTNGKPRAIAYIDDHGIRFTNWIDILNYF